MTDIVKRLRGLAYEEEWLEEAANEIDRLRERIKDAELALNIWDKGHDSEYWLRHPGPMSQ